MEIVDSSHQKLWEFEFGVENFNYFTENRKIEILCSGRSQIWDLIMKRKILDEINWPRRTHPKGPRRTQSTVLMAVRHGSVRH